LRHFRDIRRLPVGLTAPQHIGLRSSPVKIEIV
jgi:hypothetical protein